ncbi:MAG: pyrroline-5-carboxylate reductase [Ruthenibacterium sp.]
MKIGFIGFGNMAGAIAGGIIKQGLVPPGEIGVYDIQDTAISRAKTMGFINFDSETSLTTNAEYVFLCVKPQSFTAVLNVIKTAVTPEKKFLTIAAGITMDSIVRILGDVAVIRAMPNTPLMLGCGTVALTHNARTNASDFTFLRTVFESVGTVYELPENKFNEVINVNGSTPAYLYLFAKTVADYAAESGIPFETALPMFCDTMKGSAEMLLHSGKTPEELIEMVSSKGGTTVAALNKFAETGFVKSLRAGMDACVKRAYEMSL